MSVHFTFTMSSAHVQGAKNSIADVIVIVAKILSIDPPRATRYPAPFRKLMLDKRSDWTS